MTDEDRTAAPRAVVDDPRVAEIDALTAQVRAVLKAMAEEMQTTGGVKPAEVLRKLGEIQSSQLKLMEMEAVFHAKLRAAEDAETDDIETIRADIGRRLDRIRAARDAG